MISREICQRVLQKAVSTGADYAEIFAENTVNHSISMIADKVDAIKDTVEVLYFIKPVINMKNRSNDKATDEEQD